MPSVKIRVDGDSTGFEATAARVVAVAGRMQKNLDTGISRQFGKMFAAGAILEGTRRTIAFNSAMQDAGTATGNTAEAMQEMNFAATQNSATLEEMMVALKNVSQARAEALKNPDGDKALAFRRLGISRDELVSLANSRDLMFRLSDAVKGVEMNASNLPTLLEVIGARSTAVVPAMVAGLRDAAHEARELGLVIDGNTNSALERLGDKWDIATLKAKVMFSDLVLFVGRAVHMVTYLARQIPDIIIGNTQRALAGVALALDNSILGEIGKRVNKVFGKNDSGASVAAELTTAANARQASFNKRRNAFLDVYSGGNKPPVSGVFGAEGSGDDSARDAALRAENSKTERIVQIQKAILEIQEKRARVGLKEAELTAKMEKDLERIKNHREVIASEPFADMEDILRLDREIEQRTLELEERRNKQNSAGGGWIDNSSVTQADERARIGGLIGRATEGLIMPNLQRQQITAIEGVSMKIVELTNVVKERLARVSSGTSDPYA